MTELRKKNSVFWNKQQKKLPWIILALLSLPLSFYLVGTDPQVNKNSRVLTPAIDLPVMTWIHVSKQDAPQYLSELSWRSDRGDGHYWFPLRLSLLFMCFTWHIWPIVAFSPPCSFRKKNLAFTSWHVEIRKVVPTRVTTSISFFLKIHTHTNVLHQASFYTSYKRL